jgi:hypothetical protein
VVSWLNSSYWRNAFNLDTAKYLPTVYLAEIAVCNPGLAQYRQNNATRKQRNCRETDKGRVITKKQVIGLAPL